MSKKNKNMLLVWNRPVDPAKDNDFRKRSTRPVTLEDLGGTYLTAGIRHFAREDKRINLVKLRKDLDQWHNPRLKPGQSSKDLLSHNFGPVVWLDIDFLRASNWKKAIEEIRKRILYVFDCWGTLPGCKEAAKGGFSWVIPDDTHNYLINKLGKYFLSWDNGENDGRWFWQSMRICPAQVSRQEVYQYFLGWFQPFRSDFKNYISSLCSLTFPHYFAKMDGERMIGAQFLQGLPSVPMWVAWVRGAARQYQILWMAGISIYNMFGYKSFEDDKFRNFLDFDIGKGNPHDQGGPDRGPSMSLIKQVWYILFIYGVNIEALETSQFLRPAGPSQPSIPSSDRDKEKDIAPEAKMEYLSPLGKMQLEATAFCLKNAKRRGVQYSPVGALLNFYSGWIPPRHLYSDSFYTVWGGIPYEKGDHQIDLFFREIYPGYQDSAYFRNERGFLTPTPHGDIVDVLLDDVKEEILSRYQVIWVLGDITVKNELLAKLIRYVKKGGKLIWSLSQLSPEAVKTSGLESVGREVKATGSCHVENRKRFKESTFTYPKVKTSSISIILKSEKNHPLVVKKLLGKGEITTLIVPLGLCHKIEESHPLVGADPLRDTTAISFFDKPLGSPYRFLEGVKRIVFPYLEFFNLIEVIASKDPVEKCDKIERPVIIQYITNVTDKPDKLIVTLVNNKLFPVYVLLKVKKAGITAAIDLLHQEQKMPLKDACLPLTLFPCDSADFNLYIIELQLDKSVVEFMER